MNRFLLLPLLAGLLVSCEVRQSGGPAAGGVPPREAARPAAAPADCLAARQLRASLRRPARPGQLVAYVLRSGSADSLWVLDYVACRSDGEAAEEVDLACQRLWEQNLPLFARYLQQHPRSCLKRATVMAFSANFIDRATRTQELTTFRIETAKRAVRLGLSPAEKVLVQQIAAAVDPTLFD